MTDRPKTGQPDFRIGNLGEIAIRCGDHAAMVAFYTDILRLEPIGATDGPIRFFRLAPGYLGHTQVLALFSGTATAGEASSLHHIALGIAAKDQACAANWLNAHGHVTRYDSFPWIGWRGLFTTDPDGNTVELVAHVGPAEPVTLAELRAAQPDVLAAPKTDAPIATLCFRPDFGQRLFPMTVTLTPDQGIPGERWGKLPWLKLPDGRGDPRIQVSILPARVMDLVWRDRVNTPHPGDTIVADLDCGTANLPPGTLIAAGSAVLRVSDRFNEGCAKWKVRYGTDAHAWISSDPDLRLRGILCEIVKGGEVALTDRLQVLR